MQMMAKRLPIGLGIVLLLALAAFFWARQGQKADGDASVAPAPAEPMPAESAPMEPTRAVWVTRWEFNSPNSLRKIMANAASIGLNTVYLQVRGEATVFYKSAIDPWAIELHKERMDQMGVDPGWDPLAVAIEAAHANGLKLEAYVNIMPVWQHKTPPPANSGHVFVEHPEWLMVNRQGKRMDPSKNHFYACLNPVREDVRAYLVSVVRELATRYPQLDGIHYDYIRYPSEAGDYSYDKASLADFARRHHDLTPARSPQRWRRWRCENIDRLLGDMRAALKEAAPQMNISAATYAGYKTAVNAMGQRWLDWGEKGLVDDVVPMLYEGNMANFEKALDRFFKDGGPQGHLIVGIAPPKKGKECDTAKLNAQLALIEGRHADGYAIFSYSALFPRHAPNDSANAVKAFNEAHKSPEVNANQ